MSRINIAKNYVANIIQELWRQRESEEFCDVVLIAGAEKKRIPAHRCILSAASEYFSEIFMPLMSESTTKGIEMPIDVDSDILQILVQYCYTGHFKISADRLVELLKAAEVLQLQDIFTDLTEILAKHLHPSNCLGFARLAEQYQCETFLQTANEYSFDHFMEVRETDEFLKLNAKELGKLLDSDNLCVSSEENIFNSLRLWIEHNRNERKQHQEQLLRLVRLPLLGEAFLKEYVKPMCTSLESLQIYTAALEQRTAPYTIKQKERKLVKPSESNQQLLMGLTISGSKMYVCYYCPQRLQWQKCSKELEFRWYHGLAVMEDNVFLVGGHQFYLNPLDTVVCLNLKTMNLKEVRPMLEYRDYCCAAILNGFLYALGGKNKDGNGLSSVEKWDPKTNTWSRMAYMHYTRYAFGVAVLNDKLYAVGGIFHGNKVSSAECYDPITNFWVSIAPMHEARDHFSLAVSNGLLYALGGYGGVQTIESYNSETNSWTMLCSLRKYLPHNEPCTAFRDKIIVCYED